MTNTKISADEMLNAQELENVSGGTIPQTATDSKFLYEHGLVNDWHNGASTIFHWDSYSKAVEEGWKKAGITCVTKPGVNFSLENDNKYFVNGKEISRDAAYKMVREKIPQSRRAD